MYTVALNTEQTSKTFSMTVRDFEKSPHWKCVNEYASSEGWNPVIYRDTRENDIKPFAVMAHFDSETEARKFSSVMEAAYLAAGWARETVKVIA